MQNRNDNSHELCIGVALAQPCSTDLKGTRGKVQPCHAFRHAFLDRVVRIDGGLVELEPMGGIEAARFSARPLVPARARSSARPAAQPQPPAAGQSACSLANPRTRPPHT